VQARYKAGEFAGSSVRNGRTVLYRPASAARIAESAEPSSSGTSSSTRSIASTTAARGAMRSTADHSAATSSRAPASSAAASWSSNTRPARATVLDFVNLSCEEIWSRWLIDSAQHPPTRHLPRNRCPHHHLDEGQRADPCHVVRPAHAPARRGPDGRRCATPPSASSTSASHCSGYPAIGAAVTSGRPGRRPGRRAWTSVC